MSFAQDNGYTPATVGEIMEQIREGINTQFSTSFTQENFEGTRWYGWLYTLAQRAAQNEIKTSEIFAKLQQYIATTNLRIQRPSVSHPGIIDSFKANGYQANVKPVTEGDAGTLSVCVNVDGDDPDYAETKVEICQLLKNYVAAGIITMGTETESIVLTNGQSFDFKFFLPTKIPILLRVTTSISENSLVAIPDEDEIRQEVFDQINARYQLGWNFEPQRYLTLDDAPWAESVLLEWSDNDGGSWHDEVYNAAFDEVLTFGLEDIEVSIS